MPPANPRRTAGCQANCTNLRSACRARQGLIGLFSWTAIAELSKDIEVTHGQRGKRPTHASTWPRPRLWLMFTLVSEVVTHVLQPPMTYWGGTAHALPALAGLLRNLMPQTCPQILADRLRTAESQAPADLRKRADSDVEAESVPHG